MKSKIFQTIILFTLLINFEVKCQPQLWGIASSGGSYGTGVIFKTDNSGANAVGMKDFVVQNDAAYSDYTNLVQASNGMLYGITVGGGANCNGVLFSFDPNTNSYTKKIDFNSAVNGSNPHGSLIQATDGNLYGMTNSGGQNDMGVLFQYNPISNTITNKIDFNGSGNGCNPYGSLLQAADGKLYGMTKTGGTNNKGVIFQYDLTTNTIVKKLDFTGANGSNPYGSLIQAANGKLYGLTYSGGQSNLGVLFLYDPALNTYTKKIDFIGAATGGSPFGSLMQATNGVFYGMTAGGGTSNMGVLFQYDPTANVYTRKVNFAGTTNGRNPQGSLMQAADGKLYGMTQSGGTQGIGILFNYEISTNTIVKKLDFNGTSNGSYPAGTFMQASNGKLYGMTLNGGSGNAGILFQFDPVSYTLIKKIDFKNAPNGKEASGSLTLASDRKLYGMTPYGGANNMGTLFQYDLLTNSINKKFDFAGLSNGASPMGSLIEAKDGKLYGITNGGGTNNAGVLFQYDPVSNTCTKKIDFMGINNGGSPYGSLTQAKDGNLYGMTRYGGTNNKGILFRYDPQTNILVKKFDFDGTNNGAYPTGSLTQAANGKLYGMTNGGGANDAGVMFQYDTQANIFVKIYDFTGTDGANPYASLVESVNGKLYGLTYAGGDNEMGVLFEMDPATNVFDKKIDFDGTLNGSNPYGSLLESNGKLYGMTSVGGINDKGVLFQYDPVPAVYTKKLDFNGTGNGQNPIYNSLIEVCNTPVPTGASTQSFCSAGNPSIADLTATGVDIKWYTSQNSGEALSDTTPLINGNHYYASQSILGCESFLRMDVTIIINQSPNVIITGVDSICVGSSTELTASGAYSYIWTNGSQSSTNSVFPLTDASYVVTGTDANGCTGSASYLIIIKSLPIISASASPASISSGQSSTLTATGGMSYLWNNGHTTYSQTVSPVNSTSYSVTGTGFNGCSATSSVSVTTTGVTNTKLTAAFCGATLATPSTTFGCDAVANATNYEYEFTDAATNAVTLKAKGSYSTAFNLHSNAPALEAYGKTYSVRVRAYVGGVWGDFGTVCQLSTPANVPTSQLTAAFCGATLATTTTTFGCVTVASATNYEFEFTDIVTNVITLKTTGSYSTAFNLHSVAVLEAYGKTYSVRVRAYAGTWGSFGTPCQLSTPSNVPATKLTNTFCGATLVATTSTFACDAVTSATNYEFEFTDIITNVITLKTTGSYSSSFNLHNVPVLEAYGKTYSVRVRAYAGTWGSFGTVCRLSTPTTIPATKLTTNYCGATLATTTTTFSCDAVPSATDYEYEFTDATTNVITTKTRGSYSTVFNLNMIPQLALNGKTYNVRVRAFAGSWGTFGAICQLKTPGAARFAAAVIEEETLLGNNLLNKNLPELKTYPNPSKGTFTLQSNMSGKYMIMNELGEAIKTYILTEENNNTQLIDGLGAGLYIIITNQTEGNVLRKIIVTE